MSPVAFPALLARALTKRAAVMAGGQSDALRLFSAEADGLPGVFIDRYGDVAILILHEGVAPPSLDLAGVGEAILAEAAVGAVYLKSFPRDRSRLGSEPPQAVLDPIPLAGVPTGESLTIREHHWKLEVRPYEGWSTGLFLDQRENRLWVHDLIQRLGSSQLAGQGAVPPAVLNTFAYTCAFSVAAAKAGAVVASVDVSARYLDWGKRNFALNGLSTSEETGHRFARMDTFEFLGYAQRKGLKYDLIILDPPSFGSGNKRKGIRPWSAVDDYSRLIAQSLPLLNRNGTILASTNTTALCQPGQLERQISKALPRKPRWLSLPPPPEDFKPERHRFAALAFSIG